MSLNENQAKVATSVHDHNLVIALPGSGKTHTMMSYISNLVQNKDAKILALTFTNAAATEMKSRVAKLINSRARKQVFISTFHSIIIQMVKKHPELNARERLIGHSENRYNYFIFKQMVSSYNIRKEPAKEGVEPFTQKECKAVFSMTRNIIKNRLLKLNGDICKEGQRFIDVMGFDYFEYYSQKLQELNVWPLDFMCHSVTKMLVNGEVEPIKCTYCIVDEFQDTDDIQYHWIKCHGDNGTLITVVGDDDQAIYSWRNSLGMEGVRRFKADFSPIYHTLSMCYRCPPEILYAAESVVLQNTDRVDKEMNTLEDCSGDMYLIPAESEIDEMSYMVGAMRKHHLESRAILTRTNEQLDTIEGMLKIENIPYKRLNGTSIWKNEHLLFWVHLVFTIIEPAKNVFLKNVLIELGEDQQIIFDIMNKAQGVGFAHVEDEMLWTDNTNILYGQCRENGNKGSVSDSDEIGDILELISSEFGGRLSKPQHHFFNIFKSILVGMKNSLALRIDSIIDLSRERQVKELDDDVVILTTFHGSKGLEWDLVWLGGVNVDKLPLSNSKIAEEDINYPEERRLLYVAMTRAKRHLYLSWYNSQLPSNFLLEAFPEEMTKILADAKIKKELAEQNDAELADEVA